MAIDPALTAGRSAAAPRGHGMVATSQRHAVAAGIAILRRGGNAADAAVAMGAAMAVTEPTSGGLGGDCFAIYRDALSGEVSALDGSGRAPAALTLERLEREGIRELPPFHAHTVTVPGACAGWFDLVERHGALSMADVLAPAIALAADGFAVAPITAHMWETGARVQLAHTLHGRELLIEGRAPRAGERFRNPAMARVLDSLAREGPDVFYRGWIADAIVSAVREAGGVLALADLDAHRSTWRQTIATDFAGVRVHQVPPSGQGLVALLALRILSAVAPDQLGRPLTADRVHTTVEALRLAFADGLAHIADPEFAAPPVDELLDPAYAAGRAALIDPARAAAEVSPGPLAVAAGPDTYYLTVVDGGGNACSFIQSCYMGFGTGIVPAETGFTLQNRGHNFSLDPAHPNALAPGKRPYHTIIPALATTAGGALAASFGVMGGFMQPQGHVQVALALWHDGADPQAALDRPRARVSPHHAGSQIALEDGHPAALAGELAARGHQVRVVGGLDERSSTFGRGQVIVRAPDGTLLGGSDERGDGCVGWE
jgi:gamma-glutamyltranspeptidase/glutathione hydrolase